MLFNMSLLDATSEIAKELLWPTRCAVCDAPGEVLCANCKKQLRYVDSNKACRKCGAFGGSTQCSECNDIMLELNDVQKFPLDELRHCVVLNEDARRIVTAFKDGSELRLASQIAQIMAQYVKPEWVEKKCVVTFIPPTNEAVARRGFNHMELIARELCKRCHLDCASLFETPKSTDQRALTRKERIANMKRVLIAQPTSQQIKTKPVLIIDDVCTTGATIYSASLSLKNAGFTTIWGLTFARVMN